MYEGPYKVIRRTHKNFFIEKMEHEIKVSIDRLKPAHTIDDGNDTPQRKHSSLEEIQGLPEKRNQYKQEQAGELDS